LDAVGDQLRRQIVVITAGVERRPMQGKIAIARMVDDKFGAEIVARIARIHSDAARELA